MAELNPSGPPQEPIQGLWIGARLSTLERLTIRSFQCHGHAFHLYVYDEVAAVPRGTVLHDASAIMPASRIFRYSPSASYAGFANLFRYQLLHERGGWWVDMDTVCLRPFDFVTPYVFASEDHQTGPMVTSGILKTPAGAPILAAAREIAATKKAEDLSWGETGPRLLASLVERFGLDRYAEPPATFCPIPWLEWRRLINSDLDPFSLPAGVHAIHMWNEMWRREGQDKDARYPRDSPYERLKRRYLTAPRPRPGRR